MASVFVGSCPEGLPWVQVSPGHELGGMGSDSQGLSSLEQLLSPPRGFPSLLSGANHLSGQLGVFAVPCPAMSILMCLISAPVMSQTFVVWGARVTGPPQRDTGGRFGFFLACGCAEPKHSIRDALLPPPSGATCCSLSGLWRSSLFSEHQNPKPLLLQPPSCLLLGCSGCLGLVLDPGVVGKVAELGAELIG